MLSYVPFLQPLALHDWWWFTLVPMSFFIALAYKGVRMKSLEARAFWRAVLVMSAQVVLALMALAFGLFVFVEFVVPYFSAK
ncbi:MAG: hypothetical protein ACKVZJ_06930 [Phycisphaerales bacterium]